MGRELKKEVWFGDVSTRPSNPDPPAWLKQNQLISLPCWTRDFFAQPKYTLFIKKNLLGFFNFECECILDL